jgi:hypothetical protein
MLEMILLDSRMEPSQLENLLEMSQLGWMLVELLAKMRLETQKEALLEHSWDLLTGVLLDGKLAIGLGA